MGIERERDHLHSLPSKVRSLYILGHDLFVTGRDGLIADRKRKLAAKFKMKDLGMMHYFLGMEVWQNVDGIFLGQGKYAVEILKRFGRMDCKIMGHLWHQN